MLFYKYNTCIFKKNSYIYFMIIYKTGFGFNTINVFLDNLDFSQISKSPFCHISEEQMVMVFFV